MATQQEVIKTFMTSLDNTSLSGTAAVDEAIRACSNFTGTQDMINNILRDCRSTTAEDFLVNYCGIILDNADTGAITGSDAGGSTVKTAESIVPENSSLINFTGNSFTTNGLTFTLENDFDNLSTEEQFIWQGFYTYWAKGALDLIAASYGYSFTNPAVNFKNVTISFVDDSTTTLRAWNHWYDTDEDGKVDKVTLVVNMLYYKDIDTTNPNGYSSSAGFYLDKTLAHELTHTLMHAQIFNSYELPAFISEGTAELTIGIDDEREDDISYLAANPSILVNNLNGTSSDYSYAAGYMFLRYLAKQASSVPTPDPVTPVISSRVYAGGDQIISDYQSGEQIVLGTMPTGWIFGGGNFALGSATGNLFIANANDKLIDFTDAAGNSFLKAYSATNAGTIDGRGLSGYEYINGSDAGADIIFAGDGGSQLWGGADVAQDVLVGGGGADIFIGGKYQGADVFANASSTDVISLNDATLSDIVAANETNNVISIAFNTGNVIAVGSSELVSAAFVLADGSAWRYNHVTKSWQGA